MNISKINLISAAILVNGLLLAACGSNPSNKSQSDARTQTVSHEESTGSPEEGFAFFGSANCTSPKGVCGLEPGSGAYRYARNRLSPVQVSCTVYGPKPGQQKNVIVTLQDGPDGKPACRGYGSTTGAIANCAHDCAMKATGAANW